MRLPGDGKTVPILQTPFNETEGRLSPDGRWLAYTSDESGRNDVYVRSFPAGETKRRISQSGGRQASWRRDGRELVYRTDDGDMMAVAVRTDGGFDASAPQALFRARIQKSFLGRYDYAFTGDGQRFLVNLRLGSEAPPPVHIILNWKRN